MSEFVWFTCERCGQYKGRQCVPAGGYICVSCESDITEPKALPPASQSGLRDTIARRLLQEAGVL